MAETLSRTPYIPNSANPLWFEGNDVDSTPFLNKSAKEQSLSRLRAMQPAIGHIGLAEVDSPQEQDRTPSQAALQKLGSSAIDLTENGVRSVGYATEGIADGALALLGAERPNQLRPVSQTQPLPRQMEYELAR